MGTALLRAGGVFAVVVGGGALLTAALLFLVAFALDTSWNPGIYVGLFGVALLAIGGVCLRLAGPEDVSALTGYSPSVALESKRSEDTGRQDRSTWTDPVDYANALVALVGQPLQRKRPAWKRIKGTSEASARKLTRSLASRGCKWSGRKSGCARGRKPRAT